MILLRGFDQRPEMPRFPRPSAPRAAAVAAYPMYRGLARLVGMEVLKTGGTFAEEVATLREHWSGYDFFFLHYKDTDKAGEDGDFDAKVAALERWDALLPEILALAPDVLVVSGDHATPAILAGHGWQPVPALVSSAYCGGDPGHALHRARLRRRHAGPDPRSRPDAGGDGQRAAASPSTEPEAERPFGVAAARGPRYHPSIRWACGFDSSSSSSSR